MFERLTDDARKIVVQAQIDARALGHQTVGTEHILLALAEAQSCCTAQVLTDVGVSSEQVREQLILRLGVGEQVRADSPVPWTHPAKKLLELSLRQMLERDDPDIGTDHMLLASTLVNNSGSREILAERDIGFDQLKPHVDKHRLS
jgi:ATP-dependent Clp protease ATP-binding subunit ClpC